MTLFETKTSRVGAFGGTRPQTAGHSPTSSAATGCAAAGETDKRRVQQTGEVPHGR